MKRNVFYSFHYANDVSRVQMIRNIGAVEKSPIVSANRWEEIKAKGDKAIEAWINLNLKGKSCLIVLIGEETANSKWVDYEIRQAWDAGKGVFGIYIHNLKNLDGERSNKGKNPFFSIPLQDDSRLSSHVTCYNPSINNTYSEIATNLEDWVESAIASRN